MSESSDALASQLLQRLAGGERQIEARLFDLVYADLKQRAHGLMRKQAANHTLQTTALVHEAWLRLGAHEQAPVNSRTHYFRVASRAMRSVLVDHARARATEKRGGAAAVVSIEDANVSIDGPGDGFLALDEALTELAKVDRDMVQIAEMRLFGGLEHAEIADTLGVSTSTIERAWKLARAWLQRHLDEAPEP